MNGKCDVYAYEGQYGYVIHLAGRKRKHIDKAPPDPFEAITSDKGLDEYIKRSVEWNKWAESPEGNVFEDLRLPHAGESFDLPTLEDFKNKLVYLRELGYTFPDYVLETIDEEMKDEQA